MPTINLTDHEYEAVTAAIRRAIEDDRFPRVPRLDPLRAALARLAMRGRVVLCGGIANYNATEPPPGPKDYLNLIVQRGRMEGFLVLDFMSRTAEAIGALAGWVQAGKLKNKVDVEHGLENAPATLRRLFEGRNEGKQLLRVAE